jgi:C4-dicarboxylate-specific signal transduction histidine kinase
LRFLKRQAIRRQFVAVICALLLPLVIAVLWSANRTRLERQQDVRQFAQSVASTSSALLDELFSSLDAVAAATMRHPAVMAVDPDCCERLFADLLSRQPLLIDAVLVPRDGTLRAGLPGGSGAQMSRPWVARVISTERPVVSNTYMGPVSGKPVVTLGYPVRDGSDSVVGALGLSIDLSRLQAVFKRVPLPAGSVITLVDPSGLVLARSVDSDRFVGTTVSPPPTDIDAAETNVVTGPDGVERIQVADVVDRGPWTLTVAIPRTFVTERLRPLRWRNAAIIGIAALALLVLGMVVAWQTALHLNRLRSAAQQIAEGNLSPPSRIPSPNLELDELQEAFIQMARNLRDTRDALDRQVGQERKMNETLQSLQRQVVRQERLAAVGLLVSGVAHELNNPLQAILGTAELLERQEGMSVDAIEEIGFMKTQSGRAREIIRNLSRFSSQQSGSPELVDLRAVVAEVVQLRRGALDASSISLDVDMTSTRQVYASFTELEQVILNFVINAQQSIESSGRGPGRILLRLADSGRKIRLEVADDGLGVDPADEPKLFQPFFTTKPVGKGTGLGLSVSYGIIESYGGVIGYTGNAWGGATFYFELPATEVSGGAA